MRDYALRTLWILYNTRWVLRSGWEPFVRQGGPSYKGSRAGAGYCEMLLPVMCTRLEYVI